MSRSAPASTSNEQSPRDYLDDEMYLLLQLRVQQVKLKDVDVAPPISNVSDSTLTDYLKMWRTRPHQKWLLIPYYCQLPTHSRWIGLVVEFRGTTLEKIFRIQCIDPTSDDLSTRIHLKKNVKHIIRKQQLTSLPNNKKFPKVEEIDIEDMITLDEEAVATYSGARTIENLLYFIRSGDEKPTASDDISSRSADLLLAHHQSMKTLFPVLYHNRFVSEKRHKNGFPQNETKQFSLHACEQVVKAVELIHALGNHGQSIIKALNTERSPDYRKLFHKALLQAAEKIKEVDKKYHVKYHRIYLDALFKLWYRNFNEKQPGELPVESLRVSDLVLQTVGKLASKHNEPGFFAFKAEYRQWLSKLTQRLDALRVQFGLMGEMLSETLSKEKEKGKEKAGNTVSEETQAAVSAIESSIVKRSFLFQAAQTTRDPRLLVLALNSREVPRQDQEVLEEVFREVLALFKERYDERHLQQLLAFAKVNDKDLYVETMQSVLLIPKGKRGLEYPYRGIAYLFIQAAMRPALRKLPSQNPGLWLENLVNTLREAGVVSGAKGGESLTAVQLNALMAALVSIGKFRGEAAVESAEAIEDILVKLEGHSLLRSYLIKSVEQALVRVAESLPSKTASEIGKEIIDVVLPSLIGAIGALGSAASMVVTFGLDAPVALPVCIASGLLMLTPLLGYIGSPRVSEQPWFDRWQAFSSAVVVIEQLGHRLSEWQQLLDLMTIDEILHRYLSVNCLHAMIDLLSQQYRSIPASHPGVEAIRLGIVRFFEKCLVKTHAETRLFILGHLRHLKQACHSKETAQEALTELNTLLDRYLLDERLLFSHQGLPQTPIDRKMKAASSSAKRGAKTVVRYVGHVFNQGTLPKGKNRLKEAKRIVTQIASELRHRDNVRYSHTHQKASSWHLFEKEMIDWETLSKQAPSLLVSAWNKVLSTTSGVSSLSTTIIRDNADVSFFGHQDKGGDIFADSSHAALSVLKARMQQRMMRIKQSLKEQRKTIKESPDRNYVVSGKARLRFGESIITDGDVTILTGAGGQYVIIAQNIAEESLFGLDDVQEATRKKWNKAIIRAFKNQNLLNEYLQQLLSKQDSRYYELCHQLGMTIQTWLKSQFLDEIATTKKDISPNLLGGMIAAWWQQNEKVIKEEKQTSPASTSTGR